MANKKLEGKRQNNDLRWNKNKAENITVPKKYNRAKEMSLEKMMYWAKYHSWECFKMMLREGIITPLNNLGSYGHFEQAQTYLNTAGYSQYDSEEIVEGWLKGWLEQ